MIKDFLLLAVSNLRKRGLRSWLTMIGIFIGIALLVSLVSLGQGLQKSLTDEFEKLGSDKLFIMTEGGFLPPGELKTIELDDSDVKAIGTAAGIVDVVGLQFSSAKVEFNDQTKYVFATAWPIGNELFDEFMEQYDISHGRTLRSADNDKVLLGASYRKDFFDKSVQIRDRIEINDKDFRVVGFLDEVGNSQDDVNIYMTKKAYQDLYDVGGRVEQIMAKVAPGVEPADAAENVEKVLRNHRNVDEGKEDFTVDTAEDLLSSFDTILLVVQVFLFSIAAISIAVGGVGITNTMYTAVLERTKEIGIMKAIGATNQTVLLIFVIESGVLGLAGGSIGIAIGMGISKLVEIAIHFTGNTMINVYFPWYLIVGALLFSYGTGTASGIMPAIQASKQRPVDSLRYE